MGPQATVNGDHSLESSPYHDSPKPWVVQKFGGTSVGKFADRIVDNVVRYACNRAFSARCDRTSPTLTLM